ncbi:MAG: putative F420-0 ABC transporter substrate-binding protein [Bifidobacteriaceae bacterium]|jgi:iron complex transport system substrate-binding protein|nr:putative F420-0 ABC transporter substrate-binding protein [Bifidobacteriaceae bacterium]
MRALLRRFLLVALSMLALVWLSMLAGCEHRGEATGGQGTGSSVATGSTAMADGAGATDSPATTDGPASISPSTRAPIDNCGFTVELGEVPQRIVTVKSSPLELLLALGLGERVVGAAYLDGPLPDWLAAAPGAAVTERPLAEKVPSLEAVLALTPDMVFAGWESNVGASGIADRARLAELGVRTYVAPAACQEPAYQPNPLTFESVMDGIRQAGQVFGAEAAAESLVSQQQALYATVQPVGGGRTALWWSSATDTPYVGAGIGAPALIMQAVGLTNVAGDVAETWTSYSWEAVAAADPDVLVLVDSTWNTAQHKIDFLESSPLTRSLTAVQERRYLTVPFAATEAGVRTVHAMVDLATQLESLDG